MIGSVKIYFSVRPEQRRRGAQLKESNTEKKDLKDENKIKFESFNYGPMGLQSGRTEYG